MPLAELNDYQSRLKSLTGGQGSYTIEFARYSAVPPTCSNRWRASSSCTTKTNKACILPQATRPFRNTGTAF